MLLCSCWAKEGVSQRSHFVLRVKTMIVVAFFVMVAVIGCRFDFSAAAMAPHRADGTTKKTVVAPSGCMYDIVKRTMTGYGLTAEAGRPSRHVRPPHVNHTFAALQQTAASNMRLVTIFDAGDCEHELVSGVQVCGHCTRAGQRVTDFQGSTVTCTDNDILTTPKRRYLDRLTERAKAFLQRAVKILNPVQGSLLLDGSASCGGTPMRESDRNNGVPDADFVLYITASPFPGGIAWAGYCRYDFTDRRPYAGHINFNPVRLQSLYADGDAIPLATMTPSSTVTGTVSPTGGPATQPPLAVSVGPATAVPASRLYDPIKEYNDALTMVHEMMHSLGFDSPWFRHPLGIPSLDGGSWLPSSSGYDTVRRPALNKDVTIIKSPRVLREARLFFACPTLDGVEIEDGGGGGTAGSHWEKRLFDQDFMNGQDTSIMSFITPMSMAMLEDAGWYTVDYRYAQATESTWGYKRGCAFLTDSCGGSSNRNLAKGVDPDDGEFCFDNFTLVSGDSVSRPAVVTAHEYCTHERMGKGYCDMLSHSELLPSNERYFNDSRLGSSNDIRDYCPIVERLKSQACIDTRHADLNGGGSGDLAAFRGETYGLGSRCYRSNLVRRSSGESNVSLFSWPTALVSQDVQRQVRCFLTRCNTTRAMLIVTVDGTDIECPPSGLAGLATLPAALARRFDGTIECPPYRAVCRSPDNDLTTLTRLDDVHPPLTSASQLRNSATMFVHHRFIVAITLASALMFLAAFVS